MAFREWSPVVYGYFGKTTPKDPSGKNGVFFYLDISSHGSYGFIDFDKMTVECTDQFKDRRPMSQVVYTGWDHIKRSVEAMRACKRPKLFADQVLQWMEKWGGQQGVDWYNENVHIWNNHQIDLENDARDRDAFGYFMYCKAFGLP